MGLKLLLIYSLNIDDASVLTIYRRGSTGFEHSVELAAVFDNFPGSGKARGDHESITGGEFVANAILAEDHDTAGEQMAELVAPCNVRGQRPRVLAHTPAKNCSLASA